MLTYLAAQVNQGLCTRFAVQYYPTLLWASPPTLAQADRLTKAEELDELKNAHSAEKLLERINERVAKYVLENCVWNFLSIDTLPAFCYY